MCVTGGSGCKYPGAPAHSEIIFSNDSLAVGTVATYFCEPGFELLGPSRRVCGGDSQWTPEGIPFCGKSLGVYTGYQLGMANNC